MPTNLAIDDNLLAEAHRLGGQPSKKATVNEALRRYIHQLKQVHAIKAFGTVEFDPHYDYKRERRRR